MTGWLSCKNVKGPEANYIPLPHIMKENGTISFPKFFFSLIIKLLPLLSDCFTDSIASPHSSGSSAQSITVFFKIAPFHSVADLFSKVFNPLLAVKETRTLASTATFF